MNRSNHGVRTRGYSPRSTTAGSVPCRSAGMSAASTVTTTVSATAPASSATLVGLNSSDVADVGGVIRIPTPTNSNPMYLPCRKPLFRRDGCKRPVGPIRPPRGPGDGRFEGGDPPSRHSCAGGELSLRVNVRRVPDGRTLGAHPCLGRAVASADRAPLRRERRPTRPRRAASGREARAAGSRSRGSSGCDAGRSARR